MDSAIKGLFPRLEDYTTGFSISSNASFYAQVMLIKTIIVVYTLPNAQQPNCIAKGFWEVFAVGSTGGPGNYQTTEPELTFGLHRVLEFGLLFGICDERGEI